MRIWQNAFVLLVSLILIGTTACEGIGGASNEVVVQEIEVVRGDLIVSISGSGSIDVSNEADLTFGLGGNIDKLYVEEDDEVIKGDILATLDKGNLELALADAQSAYAMAIAAQAQAIAAYEQAKATLDAAEYDLYILTKRHVSYEQQRILKLQIRAAELQLDASRLQMNASELQLTTAEKAITEAEKQIERATISAPFTGTVTMVNVDEGDVAMAGQIILQIIDLTTLELGAEVDEIDVAEVVPGQQVVIEVDALPELTIDGEVLSVSSLPQVSAGVVLYEVQISFEFPKGSGLRVGMSANADIIINESKDVLLIPTRAIQLNNQGNAIVEVKTDKQIEERKVITGISDGFMTEIVSGLEEGEIILRKTG